MEEVIVAGKTVELSLMKKEELKGIPIDTKIQFQLYHACFNGFWFCLLQAKKDENHASIDCLKLAKRLETMVRLPVVFLFQSLQFVERNRLIERGVYFIVSGKYAYLPFMVINSRENGHKKTEGLLSVAQYILLYHLQVENLEGSSMMELEAKIPYNYVAISRAFKALNDLELCKVKTDGKRVKRLHFEETQKMLWSYILPYLKNPVKRVLYCDGIENDVCLTLGGITALSYYTHLNPDETNTYAMGTKQFKDLQASGVLKNLNETEGDFRLEVWNYPPLRQEYADPLSLYLTLKEDKDPRVEKELEMMIDRLW